MDKIQNKTRWTCDYCGKDFWSLDGRTLQTRSQALSWMRPVGTSSFSILSPGSTSCTVNTGKATE